MGFIVRWIVTTLAVAAAAWFVPGISVVPTSGEVWISLAIVGLVLAILNMSVKPILKALSLPITILTLGLFYLVINALMLVLTSWLVESFFGVGFIIESFGSAIIGGIIVSVVSAILGVFIDEE